MPLSNNAKSLAAIVLGLCIALALAEVVGRLLPLGTGFQSGMSYTRFHPALGFEIDPDVGRFPYQLPCLDIARVSVDESGGRVVRTGDGAPAADSEEKLRVAVLGDSFMMGREVADGEDFASQLSAIMGGAKVMNFGVPGYGTIQAYLSYKLKASALKPDITILGFLDVNDIAENSSYLSKDESLAGVRPFFAANGTDILPPRDGPPAKGRSALSLGNVHLWLKNASFTYHMMYDYVVKPAYRWLMNSQPTAVTTESNGTGSANVPAAVPAADYWWQHQDVFRYLAVYQRSPDEQFEAGWRATERALLLLRDAVRSDGGHFVLMLISAENAAWVPPALERYEQEFGEPAPPGFDLLYPAERLRQFARLNDIDVVDLGPVFAAYRDRHSLQEPHFHYRCDGHWSPLGHYIAAQSVAEHLVQQGIISNTEIKDSGYIERSPQQILGDAAAGEIFGWGKKYRGGSATAPQ